LEVLLKSDVTLGSSCSSVRLGNLKSTQTCIYLELCCTSNWNTSWRKTQRRSGGASRFYGLGNW